MNRVNKSYIFGITALIIVSASFRAEASEEDEAARICGVGLKSGVWVEQFYAVGWKEADKEFLAAVEANFTALRRAYDWATLHGTAHDKHGTAIYDFWLDKARTTPNNNASGTSNWLNFTSPSGDPNIIVTVSKPLNQRTEGDNLIGGHMCIVRMKRAAAQRPLLSDANLLSPNFKLLPNTRTYQSGARLFSLTGKTSQNNVVGFSGIEFSEFANKNQYHIVVPHKLVMQFY